MAHERIRIPINTNSGNQERAPGPKETEAAETATAGGETTRSRTSEADGTARSENPERASGTVGSAPGGADPQPGGAGSTSESLDSETGTGSPELDEAETAQTEAIEAETAETGAEVDLIEELKRERDAFLDSLLRLRAEFDNYRKRTQREGQEASTKAKAEVLAEILPILDNLDRALNAAEHHEEGKVLEGVRLTHNMFVDLLAKQGVQALDSTGAEFDPRFHEAMIFQPSSEKEGTVTDTLQRGYLLGDTVLRPARVAVSAGPAGSED